LITPHVSVILPVRNEGDYIRRSLEAVCSQDYPADKMEIIVADGMSEDETPDIVREFQRKFPQLKLIDNPGKIVPTGLNIALQHAAGEVVIRVDGHCQIAPDYVSRCVHHLQHQGVEAVGGPMETIGETRMARAIALAMRSPFGVGGSAFRTVMGKTMFVDTVPFPAYSRRVMEKAGAFDEELVRNQDDEYNYRLRKMGNLVLLAEDVRSQYYSRSSLRSLWVQFFQYGFWKVRVLQKHPAQMRLRQFAPPFFVSGLGAAAIAALWFSWGWIPLALLAGAYLSTSIAFAIVSGRGASWRTRLALPLATLLMHLAYGLGFLSGLIRFIHRWGDKDGILPSLERINA
jgi:glycosyltransferase involved in cell wall biosynthesis